MLYFDRIGVPEGIDVNKTSESRECNICHYCCFLNKSFKFQQMSLKYSTISLNWFVYELSGCEFESGCCNLNKTFLL